MAEYTEKEIREFKLKEARIVCENALSHATMIVCANPTKNEADIIDRIKSIASELVNWVYTRATDQIDAVRAGDIQDNSSANTNSKKKGAGNTLPVPTVPQKKLLERLSEALEMNMTDIQSKSLDILDHYPNDEKEGKMIYGALNSDR